MKTTLRADTHTATLARQGWYYRLHAALMARNNAVYEPLVAERKRALFGGLSGTVLEIGPGTGPNLPYYASGVRWVGVEPNLHMHEYLHRAAEKCDLAVDLRVGTAEQLPAEDASVDAVVSTLVLCSVADVEATLREVRRVLKPGGRFVFIEHVAAPQGTLLRRVQRALRPLTMALADGCHHDRETGLAIQQAGFAQVQLDHWTAHLGLSLPHISGVAIREG